MLQLASSAYSRHFARTKILTCTASHLMTLARQKCSRLHSANTAGNTFATKRSCGVPSVLARLESFNLRPGSLGTAGLLFSHRIFQSTMHLAFERVETLFAATGQRGNLPLECYQKYGTTNKTCKLRRASSVIKVGLRHKNNSISSYSPVGGIVKDSSTRPTTGLKMHYHDACCKLVVFFYNMSRCFISSLEPNEVLKTH